VNITHTRAHTHTTTPINGPFIAILSILPSPLPSCLDSDAHTRKKWLIQHMSVKEKKDFSLSRLCDHLTRSYYY